MPPNTVQGRRLVCGTSGVTVLSLPVLTTLEFADYSWPCEGCGGRHCSECSYESDGETITVHDCGRFGEVPG